MPTAQPSPSAFSAKPPHDNKAKPFFILPMVAIQCAVLGSFRESALANGRFGQIKPIAKLLAECVDERPKMAK